MALLDLPLHTIFIYHLAPISPTHGYETPNPGVKPVKNGFSDLTKVFRFEISNEKMSQMIVRTSSQRGLS